MWFRKHSTQQSGREGFPYLEEGALYMDSACQTLRPQAVLDAMMSYYTTFNACGGRVKYAWGRKVDELVAQTREDAVRFVGKHPHTYTTVFTLNTTYGINLLLRQLPEQHYSKIYTGPWEHNSVQVPVGQFAVERGVERSYLHPDQYGAIPFDDATFAGRCILMLQAVSNIDGSSFTNLKELSQEVKRKQGYVIIDAAQAVGHQREILKDVDFDACVFSAHKMYGPSLGVIVLRKSLISQLLPRFVGGGTVTDVFHTGAHFTEDETRLEPGLQDWAGIIGFGAAMKWIQTHGHLITREHKLGKQLFDGLTKLPGLTMYNNAPSSTISCYAEQVDAHRLAQYLSEKNVMVRSGYFCCHQYLKHERALPPLLRFSLGAHTTSEDVEQVLTHMSQLLTHL